MEKENLYWSQYTCRHRCAFLYTIEKLLKDGPQKQEMIRRARVHDIDKLLMYQLLDVHEAQMTHVSRARHHLDNEIEKTKVDLYETIMDYECAPYTKPDKPLNTFDFTKKLLSMKLISEELYARLLEIMQELQIDSSYDLTEDLEGMKALSSNHEISEEEILLEIEMNFPDEIVKKHHTSIREVVERKDKEKMQELLQEFY